MKKAMVAAMLCAVLLLSSCSGFSSVDELLTAPALREDQAAVKAALEEYTGERLVLKYPISGNIRMPIQFVDLDGDGIEEATAFFSTADVAVAQLAVLQKDASGSWSVVTSINGLDVDVETVNFIRIENSASRLVLVQWSSTNTRERILAPYRFVGSELVADLEETSSNLFVYDLDNDSYDEFLYITSRGGLFFLKYIDPSNGAAYVEPVEVLLDSRMNGCLGLVAGQLADGTRAVFIDESIGLDSDSGEVTYQITEVFTYSGSIFLPAVLDYDIAELSRRPDTEISCRRLFDNDSVYIPSVYPPFDDVASDQWIYWYTIKEGSVEYHMATYVDETYQFAMGIPDEWLPGVALYHEEGSRLWSIYGLGVDDVPVVSLRVLSVGDDANVYYEEGYTLLTQSGSYRFLIMGTVDDEGFEYVKDNFIVL